MPPRAGTRLRLIYAAASLLTVALGCFVAASSGAGLGTWGRNLAAWGIGAGLLWLSQRAEPARLLRLMLIAAPLALLISLASAGQQGVHRWISLGPLRWNVAFLFLPAAATALAVQAQRDLRRAGWLALVIEALLCLQPDASQATAFAAAILAAVSTRGLSASRIWMGLALVAAAAAAWSRPDPLQPVPEVEGILQLARGISLWLPALGWILLASVCASPLLAWSRTHRETLPPAVALSVYFIGCTITPLLGAYPVPLAGMGMSPILGFWLGIAALAAARALPRC
jgi:cell division protein FtsW (lipid II flippase)